MNARWIALGSPFVAFAALACAEHPCPVAARSPASPAFSEAPRAPASALHAEAAEPVPAAPAPGAKLTYVKAGKLFDGTGDGYRENVVVVIEGERIRDVAPAAGVRIPDGAETIDLSGAFVLPGFIDCHVHLSSRADRYDEMYTFRDTPFHDAFAAVVNAKKTLEAGFTTVRDLHSLPFLAVDLRTSIDEGFIPGPRVVASGPAISMTGGHTDLNGYAPQVRYEMFPEERDFKIADGADQVRHVVRAQLKHGVDVVKICASGGVFSRGDTPGAPQFTVEELRAAVEEAHAAGRKIAAHAHGTQGIKNAVIAGVDSIEHGSFLDDEAIRLMKEHGTWLVADIYNDDFILGKAAEFHIPEEAVKKERALGQRQRESFRRAVEAGVKIAFGTDAGVYPHGDNARQFAFMVKYGMTAAAALRSATSAAADILGRKADVGRLTAGHFADIVALPKDPLVDIRATEHVSWVMKGGKVVRAE